MPAPSHQPLGRYSAHTIDGSLIFSSDTMARLGDRVIDHCRAGLKPHIGYTYDNTAAPVKYRYHVWTVDQAGPPIAATVRLFETFDQVADWWEGERKWN